MNFTSTCFTLAESTVIVVHRLWGSGAPLVVLQVVPATRSIKR